MAARCWQREARQKMHLSKPDFLNYGKHEDCIEKRPYHLRPNSEYYNSQVDKFVELGTLDEYYLQYHNGCTNPVDFYAGLIDIDCLGRREDKCNLSKTASLRGEEIKGSRFLEP